MNTACSYFKFLNKEINYIATNYFLYKKELNKQLSNNIKKEMCNGFINKVNKAYELLDPIEKMFINKEFFLEAYPYWWVNIYPKWTFYRYKKKAMCSFLKNYESL